MKTRTLISLAITLVAAAAGCSKSGPGGSSGATAGPVAITCPAFDKFNGDYDHGLYIERKGGGHTLALARGCASFSCDSVDAYGNVSDAAKKSCAGAGFAVADFADRGDGKVGDNPMTIDVSAPNGETTTITGRTPLPKLSITELGADSVAGSIDFKSEDGSAKGPFKAKVCPKSP